MRLSSRRGKRPPANQPEMLIEAVGGTLDIRSHPDTEPP
jgi:hypothetical protein